LYISLEPYEIFTSTPIFSHIKSITFFAKTPFEIQEQITELISSEKILMYNEDGTDDDSKWQTLEIANNSILENNWSRSYENEIEFNLPTINRMI